MNDKLPQSLGAISTPHGFAKLLVTWSIQRTEDKVLDLGIGQGAFVFAAFERLVSLGTPIEQAQQQIYGAEIDPVVYQEFLRHCNAANLHFPNVMNLDFFDVMLPEMDVVIGNPPYVRRMYLDDVDSIRQTVLAPNDNSQEEISRLADLYVYFLLHSSQALKTNGKLAVLTADSWLNVGYGKHLRKHLLEQYEIEKLITFDRRVFDNAQVKPVFILATKKGNDALKKNHIDFIRIRNGLPVSRLESLLLNSEISQDDMVCSTVDGSTLDASHPWGVHFKLPEMFDVLKSHHLLSPMREVAKTYIGVQTLAKEFFVFSAEDAIKSGVETQYLKPLAQSGRTHNKPTIERDAAPFHYVFYCSRSKKELEGTQALAYIQAGETAEVPVRGKGTTVIGYHNKQRIKDANRKYWYDLKSAIDSRGCAEILIPRLIYRHFMVVWNKAGFVPGELFIEFVPHFETDPEIYLSILSSTLTEIMIRAYAQVYGGGTYNINPGQIVNVPIVNAALLSSSQRETLKNAYQEYVANPLEARIAIDRVLFQVFGFDGQMQSLLHSILEDLRMIATSSKESN